MRDNTITIRYLGHYRVEVTVPRMILLVFEHVTEVNTIMTATESRFEYRQGL